MKRLSLGGVAIVALIAGFGCSGGGGSTSPVPSPFQTAGVPQTAKATFKLKIPARAAAAAKAAAAKTPGYVSASTQSVQISGASVTTESVDIGTLPNANCTGPDGGGAYTCDLAFDLPIGSNSIDVKTFSGAGATGSVLSQNTVVANINGGVDNNVNIILNGVASTLLAVVTPSATVSAGTPSGLTVTLGAKDAAGNTIVGPGDLVDASGTSLSASAALAVSDSAHFAVGTQTGYAWSVAYDGTDDGPTQTVTLSATGFTDAVATITITPAATPTPSPTPTDTPTPAATPTPSPTPTPVQAITNGGFETSGSSIGPWFPCYAPNLAYNPTDASPAPASTPAAAAVATATTAPILTAPTPSTTSQDSGVATGVPSTASTAGFTGAYNGSFGSVHGGTNAARVGYTDYTITVGKAGAGKGLTGICQTVTVPTTNPKLTLWIYETSNTNAFANINHVGAYWSGAPFSTAYASPTVGGQTAYKATTTWTSLLFAQDNCYNANPGGSDIAGCAIGQPTATGGQWLQKGPYDLSGVAGTQITIFLGQYSATTTTVRYSDTYFDDVSLTGDGT